MFFSHSIIFTNLLWNFLTEFLSFPVSTSLKRNFQSMFKKKIHNLKNYASGLFGNNAQIVKIFIQNALNN